MKYLVFLCLICGIFAQTNEWQVIETTGPKPTYIGGHTAVEFFGFVYVFSGARENFTDGSMSFYPYLWLLNLYESSWEIVDSGTGPSGRAFHSAAICLGDMYVLGGATYGNSSTFTNLTIYSDMWYWNILESRWNQVVAGNEGPGPRAYFGMSSQGFNVYIFGGVTNAYDNTVNDLWAFNVLTNLWTQLLPNGNAGSPSARNNPQLHTSLIDGNMYMYGGEGPPYGFETLNDFWMYETNLNLWTNITPNQNIYIGRNNYEGTAMVLGYIMVSVGGEVPGGIQTCFSPFEQNETNQTWTINTLPGYRAWNQLFPSPNIVTIKRHTAISFGPYVYVIGGYNSTDCQTWNNNVWVYLLNLF